MGPQGMLVSRLKYEDQKNKRGKKQKGRRKEEGPPERDVNQDAELGDNSGRKLKQRREKKQRD